MPTPASAPPRVMVFSCGTTAGITPRARHAAVSASYVTMPSASTQPAPGSTARTSQKLRTSRRRRGAAARSRNRLDVSLARPTAPLPSLSCSVSASLFLVCGLAFVEEVPGHGVTGERDIALGEHHLEEVRASVGRAEHLGAAIEVHAPDAPEALVEALR